MPLAPLPAEDALYAQGGRTLDFQGMPELSFIRDLLILFGLGVAVVVAFDRLKLPPIVGFLITGVVCGPYGFGLIRGVHEVEALAEIGVVLLLFTVGIEFSVQELLRLRMLLLVGGGLQVSVTLLLAMLVAHALGFSWTVAAFLGMLVALSSTAIVIRLLSDRGEIDAPHGRAALGILIFQDLCVVPMMLVTPILGGTEAGAGQVAWIALKAVLFVGAALAAARYVVPRLLDQVVATRRRDVFLLTIILLCLGTAWASAQAGLSLALGAFIAGLVLSESEYSHEALGEMLPLREVFNSLFFVSIGMLFDVRTMLGEPMVVFGAVALVIVMKAAVTAGATLALGQTLRVAVVAGLAIAQIGEFSFILSKVGLESGLLDARLNQIFLAVAVTTMAVTPGLQAIAPRLADRLEPLVPARVRRGRLQGEPAERTRPRLSDHVIIVGYGVNGRNLARVLGRTGIPFIVIEMNPQAVRAELRRGRAIIFGDATRREVLEHAGIAAARVLVLAISDAAATRRAVALARRLNAGVHIVVRSRYVQEMQSLIALGTDEVVPEEFETSVEIFSRVLRRYLVPTDLIEQQILAIRSDSYEVFRSMSETRRPAAGVERFIHDLSLEVFRAEPGCDVAGTPLGSSALRRDSGATAVAIQRHGGEVVVNPTGTDVIAPGDAVVLLGRPEQLVAARALFRASRAPAEDTARAREDVSSQPARS